MKWIFLLLLMANCHKSLDDTQPTVSEPTADNKTIKAYQNLLAMEPVELDAAKVSLWPGLPNIGNTCFMNATLKLLARQKEILHTLKEQESDKSDENVKKLRQAFKAVINMIRLADQSPGQNAEVARYALESLRFCMSKIIGLDDLTDCKQYDANEFYAKLNGELSLFKDTPNNQIVKLLAAKKNDDTLYAARFGEVEPLSGVFQITEDSTTDKIIENFTRFEETGPKDYLVAEEGKEKVPHIYRNYFIGIDKSIVITIPTTMPGPNRSLTIRHFVVLEPKKFSISYLSDLAAAKENIGQLNGKKYESKNFKKALPKVTKSRELNLSAMVIHGGSANSGHYWAYIKDDQNNWYQNNDGQKPTLVTKLEFEKKNGDAAPNPQVYMYLYE